MKHRNKAHFTGEMAGRNGHAAHSFANHLDLPWELPKLGRRHAQARRISEMAEAGPKQFVHSRFRSDASLNAILNNRALMRSGSRGPSVVKIQQALVDLDHPLPRFGADGDFGRETRSAVVAFQRNVRIRIPGFGVDGIIGPNTMTQLDLAISRLRLRKSVAAMPLAERMTFTNTLNEWERRGLRRQFVVDHGIAGTRGAASRWRVHGNSSFLPWHRQFILNFESQLRAINDTVSLPYWDWATDPGVVKGTASWGTEMTAMIGGDGTGRPVRFNGEVIGAELLTGPIADWPFIAEDGTNRGPRLARGFGTHPTVPSLPGLTVLNRVMLTSPYDTAPFSGRRTVGFRSANEVMLHNRVHLWVRGCLGEIAVSPNDPAFFLHHCMIDKVWADWQAANPAMGYVPTANTPGSPGALQPMPVINLDAASGTAGAVTPQATLDASGLTDNFGQSQLRVRYV